jgi:hypothetical protein
MLAEGPAARHTSHDFAAFLEEAVSKLSAHKTQQVRDLLENIPTGAASLHP